MFAAVIGTVLTQRFALPLGAEQQIPLVIPLALAWLALGLHKGYLHIPKDPGRAYAWAASILAALTLVSLVRGADPSFFSLIFLGALYACGTVRLTRPDRNVRRETHIFFAWVMVALGLLGIALFAAQFAGLLYRDWLFDSLPPQFVQAGYNTAYPLFWYSDVYRSNGVVFLEASFYSLFLALAALTAIWYRLPFWAVVTLVAAMAVSASGNGVVVLGLGLAHLLVSRHRSLLLRFIPAGIAFLALLAATPLGELFLERSTEVGSDDSSASLRLVQPYQQVIPTYVSDVAEMFVGHGAGTISDFYEDVVRIDEIQGPVLLKLLYEYGVVGCLAFLAFFYVALLRRLAPRPWVPGLLAAYLLLNGALLQATIGILTVLLLGVAAERSDPRRRHPDTPSPVGAPSGGGLHERGAGPSATRSG